MKNDMDIILSYYETIGRITAVLEFDLYDTKEQFTELLLIIFKDFAKAEGKNRKLKIVGVD